MASRESDASWQRACARGVVIGLVVASHMAVVIAVLTPVKPRPPGPRVGRRDAKVLHVTLLSPPSLTQVLHASKQLPFVHSRPAPPTPNHSTHHPHKIRATASVQTRLPPASAGLRADSVPAFIPGGGFDARLRAAQTGTRLPKLPGGHHYLASDLQFVPTEQQSIKSKIHKVAGLLFGGFDPTCKNAEYELAKSQQQQIADGYTREDLKRLVQEHCR